MTTDDTNALTVDDLPDHMIEQVLNSTGFQKMLAYQKLADGIEVLGDQDQLFESMVTSIQKQHSTVKSEDSVREFFDLFVEEVESYTEGLTDEELPEDTELDDIIVEG